MKNKSETQKITPVVFLSSLVCNAGLTKRQNSQNTYGNATMNPPTNATVKDEMNCPVIAVLMKLTLVPLMHNELPSLKNCPATQSHLYVTKLSWAGAKRTLSTISRT